jgi:hypothetical protein
LCDCAAPDRETSVLRLCGQRERVHLVALVPRRRPGPQGLPQRPGGQFALIDAALDLPTEWREWLGTFRLEEVENCSLFLLAKAEAKEPGVDDAESRLLRDRVAHWFGGLMLVSKFHQTAEPFIASGGRAADEVVVQHYQALVPPQRAIVDEQENVTTELLTSAALIGESIAAFEVPGLPDHWRLLRCLGIYQAARCDRDMLNRVHQFTRCIEGLIVPEAGKTGRQFRQRTSIFIGDGYDDLMGELYEVRSHVEHMHEYRYLGKFDRV